jgi:CheY-like chemotaxis protein
MSDAEPLRILLAEDDPISQAFLAEALRGLGFTVCAVPNGEAALEAAHAQPFDALMLDHHLPGMDGDAVLRTLLADASAASRATVAIATTAEPDAAIHAQLRAAGFARVLLKPLDGLSLRDALRELGFACALNGALDDAAGLRASGSPQALAALRGLFARELEGLANEWHSVRNDALALAERLHKLRAACGFCGALALQSAAAELSDALREAESARIEGARMRFQQTLAATRDALKSSG